MLDFQVGSDAVLSCNGCSCKINEWKLIGVAIDQGCLVLKSILPLVYCEPCYRKRYCNQSQSTHVCGIAVFPQVEPDKTQLEVVKSTVVGNVVPAPSHLSNNHTNANPTIFAAPNRSWDEISSHRVVGVSRPQPQPQPQPTENPIPRPSPVVIPPSKVTSTTSMGSTTKSSTQSISSVPDTTSATTNMAADVEPSSSLMNYGVDDVLGSTRESEGSNSSVDEQPTAVDMGEMEDEVCYTVQLQKRVFIFRFSWFTSYLVINNQSIIVYTNEKRLEKKKKEIFLNEAIVSVS